MQEGARVAIADLSRDAANVMAAVINAGIQIVHPLDDFTYADWKRMLAVHINGAFTTIEEVAAVRCRSPLCPAMR